MHIFLIILAILLWAGAIYTLFARQVVAPALSFLGLTTISMARIDGLQILPVNTVMLVGWFAIALVVTIATILQPDAVKVQRRGVGYMLGGGIVGLVLGLLTATMTMNPAMIYSTMMLSVIIGVFLGFLVFSNTPKGADIGIRTGRFFRYLLAKGFPTAVTIMMPGVALLLLVIKAQVNAL